MRRTMGPCLVAVLMTQIAAGQAVALEKYLCVGEKSTGFVFRDESWSVSSFKADKDFYVIEEVDPYVSGDKTIAFAVRRVGRADYQLFCERYESDGFTSDRVECGGLQAGLLFNTKTLRFQRLDGFGFVEGKDASDSTPSLTIGKCTRLKTSSGP